MDRSLEDESIMLNSSSLVWDVAGVQVALVRTRLNEKARANSLMADARRDQGSPLMGF